MYLISGNASTISLASSSSLSGFFAPTGISQMFPCAAGGGGGGAGFFVCCAGASKKERSHADESCAGGVGAVVLRVGAPKASWERSVDIGRGGGCWVGWRGLGKPEKAVDVGRGGGVNVDCGTGVDVGCVAGVSGEKREEKAEG
jgi:hypothetical protein